jgi:hypothetical protein
MSLLSKAEKDLLKNLLYLNFFEENETGEALVAVM